MSQANLTDSGIAVVEEKRDDIEDLAESDLPCNQIAEALLEVAESEK